MLDADSNAVRHDWLSQETFQLIEVKCTKWALDVKAARAAKKAPITTMGEKQQVEEIKTPKNSQGHRGEKKKRPPRPPPCAIFQKSGGWPNQDTNQWSTGGSSVEGPQAGSSLALC